LTAAASAFPERLAAGYAAFIDGRFEREQARYRDLSSRGQKPEIMVVGCCDSRVSPEAIFDSIPGELFVTRNVANLVPPYLPDGDHHGTSAALEYAVQALRVKHIVVLGHAQCGGVAAFAGDSEPLSPGDFIGKWISMIAPAAERIPAQERNRPDYQRRLELASIENSLANLMTFPCVRILVERGKLQLHGAYFGIHDGELLARNPDTGRFEPLCERPAMRPSMIRCS
jgi:carbonic anhydrase